MRSLFGRLLGRNTLPTAPGVNELYQRALSVAGKNDLPSAIALFDQVVELNPTHAEALYKRGNALKDLGKLEAAVDSYNQAIGVRADYTYAYCNRGVLQHRLGRLEDAKASYDRAVALDPQDALTHYNRALLMQDLAQSEEALASYDRAIAINPHYAEAQYNRALAQLFLGRFEDGWLSYEWRWKLARRLSIGDLRNFGRPLWLGKEDIAGKRLLLHAEGGLGDTIQFSRYAALCAARGATVLLEVEPALVPLLRGLEGVSAVVTAGASLPDFDFHTPLMSLPLAFGTTVGTVPSADGYLAADPSLVAAWEERLGPRKGPRIGLVWSGNPHNWIDARRSIALHEWAPTLPSDFRYICLQRDVRAADLVYLQSTRTVEQVPDGLLDFSNTAALSTCLDLCICVDTSPAHLCGALGQNTWLLLPHNPDWRWLRERDDTPWYSRMRLYRQHAPDAWPGVFEKVASDLRAKFQVMQ